MRCGIIADPRAGGGWGNCIECLGATAVTTLRSIHRQARARALKASPRHCRKARPRAGTPLVARKTRQDGDAAKLTRLATRLSDCGRRAASLPGRGRRNGRAGGGWENPERTTLFGAFMLRCDLKGEVGSCMMQKTETGPRRKVAVRFSGREPRS